MLIFLHSPTCMRERETDRQRQREMEWQSREMILSPEIVEIEEERQSVGRGGKDVYVAVGKNDFDALQWAIKNALAPGSCLFLVHVFPPITSIPTPVGRLSKTQVSREQVQTYVLQENQRRQNLLQKYIRVCTESKVSVDTMLVESDLTAKAIVDLIPVLNITKLIMGARRHNARKGEFVRKNAPDFCEVTIVCNGKNIADTGHNPLCPSSSSSKSRYAERKIFECCFSCKFS